MKKKYIDFLREVKNSDEYWAETIISDFTEEICRLMKKKNISRAMLAEKIDSSPAYITKILRGNANFTLITMTKLARALGAVVRVHLAPNDVVVHWEDEQISADTNMSVALSQNISISYTNAVFASRGFFEITATEEVGHAVATDHTGDANITYPTQIEERRVA